MKNYKRTLQLLWAASLLLTAWVSVSGPASANVDPPSFGTVWLPGEPATPPWPHCPHTGWTPGRTVFVTPVQFWLQPYQLTSAVFNNSYLWLGCQIVMEGWMASGRIQRVPYTLPPLAPGRTGYSYMNPYFAGDTFINGRSWAWCQYL